MRIPTDLPHDVTCMENAWIPLADGTRLAARIWMPVDAVQNPVPAILEYLPYRKDDANASQDATRHPWFAGHGYAAVRVDLRGTGDSDGILEDEYSVQEQLDALEVLQWLEDQPWCTGNAGMIGYSWGGFNGLQIAARRPQQLKAVITMYSTDDRYTDDCHYMGGCLLGSDMLKWATWMRAYNALPPDPRYREDWREVWLDRLERTPAYIEPWMSHPVRDAYWEQGSVAVDYSAIEAATLVVGGWTDAYTNAVPRLLEHLTCERKGLIGPWGHRVPYRGIPGPAIGFLQECLRWYDRWLKGIDTKVEHDSFLRVWINDSYPPAPDYAELPGRWTEQPAWPPPALRGERWTLAAGGVLEHGAGGGSAAARGDAVGAPASDAGSESAATVAFSGAQQCGLTSGVWCVNGRANETAIDQRADDELSLCFDTPALEEPLEVLGFPIAHLALASDRPAALVAARLCEVTPDGESTLVSWGLLNLANRRSFAEQVAMQPGVEEQIALQLNAIGHRFSAGNRIRLALSPTQWPHAWPSPEPVTLTLRLDGASALELPVAGQPGSPLGTPFDEPEALPPGAAESSGQRTRERSVEGRTHLLHDSEVDTEYFSESDTTFATESHDIYRITERDPLSASTTSTRMSSLTRPGWRVTIRCEATQWCTATTFVVDDTLVATEGDEVIFERTQRFEFPRGLL